MNKFVLLIAFVFTAHFANATEYTLECSSQADSFSVVIDSDKSHLYFTDRTSFDINVDDYVYPAELSPNFKLVTAEITTYDYFFGSVKFYLGEGLKKVKDGATISIALDADDGDGFGFDKRSYNCVALVK